MNRCLYDDYICMHPAHEDDRACVGCELFCESAKDEPESALSTQEGGNHYKDMVIQPIEYCQKNKLGALESFIVKYASRHGKKNGAEDVRKIIHCAKLLLELEYGGE